ncbi:(2,3-dihydroxybenzoyl)adenylate synthase [Saccharothrix xinjiangensis]|uniref:(2,3-dihydroxybenzoyl)adenylate synthase n=1 Tax=Saccharothrix xinjiangensis TaxID=204798 RepID=A0ABV9XY92_9PSEU
MAADVVPWPADDAARYRVAGYWRGETYPEFLDRLVAAFGDRTAVVDDRVRLSYAELAERAGRVARGLRDLGVAAGDRVLVQLPNRAEFLVLWFALLELGAVPVLLRVDHRYAEVVHLARLSGAVAYVVPDVRARFDHRELAAAVRAAGPAVEHVVVVGDPGDSGFTAFDDLAADPSAEPVTGPAGSEDLALLVVSEEGAGLPKLVPRTHDDHQCAARAVAEASGLDGDSVYLAALPVALHHTTTCPGVLGALGASGAVVLADDPDPARCFELVEREGVTVTAIDPRLAPLWLEESRVTDADLSTLRVVQVVGSRLPDDLTRQVLDGFDCAVQRGFGLAEGLICLTGSDDPAEAVRTTCGRPISPADEIRVVDERDVDVPPGEVGELLAKGPYTLRGYHGEAEHDPAAFLDGFHRTGDLVRRLPSGHLVVVGRREDQIRRGGEKIAAPEVEGHLRAHPGIRSAALLPAPDPVLGERSVAFVVPSGRIAPTRETLAVYLVDRGLAAHEVPDEMRVLGEMPLTPVGKVDRRALTRLLGGATG